LAKYNSIVQVKEDEIGRAYHVWGEEKCLYDFGEKVRRK
jgi:hypothetical protein